MMISMFGSTTFFGIIILQKPYVPLDPSTVNLIDLDRVSKAKLRMDELVITVTYESFSDSIL
jgi:hypothetical protein